MDPRVDTFFFILAPLWVIPAFTLLKSGLGVTALSNFVLAYGALGHHLPGFIRVYTEPELFKRYKVRFIVAPVFLLSTCALFAYFDLNGLGMLLVLWGTWHGAMQVNGFLRIYDSKVKSFSRMTARLDWWMCLSWFGAAILHSDVKMSSILGHFYGSGGPLLPPEGYIAFRWLWDAGTAVITALFLLNLFFQWKKGQPASLLKLVSIVSAFGFWWYCMVTVNNLLVGLAMWEIFHDFQYNALVWAFNKKRVANKLPTSPLERFLFQPSWSKLGIYLALVLGYGHLGSLASYTNIHLPAELLDENNLSVWLTRLIMASGFLHFYFDGFIWKVRDGYTRQGLELKTATVQSKGDNRPVTHFLKWGLFVVPAGYLGIAQAHHWAKDPLTQHVNMSALLPDSWYAQFMAGSLYKSGGKVDASLPYFEKAAVLKPNFAPGYLLLADVYFRLGKKKEAFENYTAALRLEPNHLEGQLNLANLSLELHKPQKALQHFLAAQRLNPRNAQALFGIASAQMKLGKFSEAETVLRDLVGLESNHGQAWHYLGMLAEVKGDTSQALHFYQSALKADPTFKPAQNRLSALGASLSPR